MNREREPIRGGLRRRESAPAQRLYIRMIREYCGRNSVALAEQPAPIYSKQSRAADETRPPRTKKYA
jgi:hypothetical protein